MGEHILQAFATRVVVQQAVAIGIDSRERQASHIVLQELVDQFRAIVLGGAEHVAYQLHYSKLIDSVALRWYLVELIHLLDGGELAHDAL